MQITVFGQQILSFCQGYGNASDGNAGMYAQKVNINKCV